MNDLEINGEPLDVTSGNVVLFAGNDDDFGGLLSASLILLRNRLLDNLLKLLFTTKEKCTVNVQ